MDSPTAEFDLEERKREMAQARLLAPTGTSSCTASFSAMLAGLAFLAVRPVQFRRRALGWWRRGRRRRRGAALAGFKERIRERVGIILTSRSKGSRGEGVEKGRKREADGGAAGRSLQRDVGTVRMVRQDS
jgi:hypothetical protein